MNPADSIDFASEVLRSLADHYSGGMIKNPSAMPSAVEAFLRHTPPFPKF